MRVPLWLRQHCGWFIYLGIVATVAAWSAWDRREMPPARSGCMTIDDIRRIDETSARAAARIRRTVEQEPLYYLDDNGCASWLRPQIIYRD